MQHHLRRLKPAARPIPAIFIACLFAVFAAVPQARAVTEPFTTPGNGSWTAPAGVTSITVECWGAGGGGGGDSFSSNNTNGGGGGGGAYGKATYAVTPSSSYNFTVGTGGAGGVGTANGSDGTNSTFQTTVCIAAGGKGGSSASNGGNGGAGGLASASTGNLYSGGSGSNDVGGGNSGGGGGGGSAGTANNGTSATNSRTGATAVTGGGPGGNGSSTGGNGSAPASGPGGGGGGAKYDTANRNGGAGYDGKISITYKYATVTTISCGAGPFTYTGAAQTPCTATVTAPDGLNQSVAVSYSSNTNAGTATASASFAATTDYLASNASTTFTIDKAPTTSTVTCGVGPFTYTGAAQTPCSATVTGPGLSLTPAVTYANNTNAGTATASVSYGGAANYVASSDSKNFTINKAATTTAVTCPAGPFTYTGLAITPACTAAATGTGGLNVTGLTVTFANNVNAGTATASATYAGSANYLTSTGSKNFTINKATPTLSITNSPQVFDGTAKTADVAASATAGTVDGTYSNILYNTSATVPTDAGSYTVKVDFAPADATNYNSLTNTTAGTFVINKAASTTAITCDPGPFAYTGAAQTPCSATVTGPGLSQTVAVVYANNTNAGTASASATYAASTNYLASSDNATFIIDKAATTTAVTCAGGPFTYTAAAIEPCTAEVAGPGGLSQALTVSYANNVDAGMASADASYAGTANYFGSSDNTTFAIGKATPVLAVTNSPVAYDGTPKSATIVASSTPGTVNGALSNVKYDTSATAPADAGTYAVTADFTPTDLNNYNTLTNASAGSFTIAGAPTTTTVTCTTGPFSYTGAAIEPCSASVTGPGGFNQALTVVYADNVNAGTGTAAASFGGSGNYGASSDSTTFTIDPAATTTTVTCAAGPFTYTGAAIEPCTGSVTGPGGLNQVLTVVYANNIDAGTASADAGYAGGTNYQASSDSATFPIGKATPVLAVTNSPVTFDGTQHAATVGAGSVGGTISDVRYDGSTTAPIDAAAYAVTADFTPDDTANYNLVNDGSAGSFVIQKAATNTTVTCGAGSFVYTGSAYEPCTAVATGPAGLNQAVAVVYSDNTNAGTATASASYAGAANYLPSSGASTFPINKANPTLAVTNSPATYDGTAKAAAVNGSVAGTVSNIQYDGSPIEPTNAGSYAINADFVPDDAANYNALINATAGSFVINKANPTLSITNSPANYDGTPKTANVGSSVAGTVSNIVYNGSPTAPTDAGTYAVLADFSPNDLANYNSLTGAAAGNFVIQKAGVPTLSVTNTPLIFTGAAQAAVIVGSVPGTPSNILYNGVSTVPTDAGSYVITADFTPDDSVNYETVTGGTAGTLVIQPAATSTAVTCGAGPFTYTGAAITPCTAVVTGPGGLNQAPAVVYAGNIEAGTASASATFAATTNYLTSAGSATFTIGKATPSVAVTNSPAAYDGTPKTANVVGSVPGTVSNIRYNGSANAPVNAGTYAVTADFAPTDTANYNTLAGADAGNFVIQKAGTPVLTVSNSPVVFTGAAQAAVVASSVPGTVSNIRYNGSATVPANAGSYVITADFVPNDTVNFDSITGAAAGSFTIGRAATTTTIDCGVGTYTYTGAAITPCTANVTGQGGLSAAVTVSYSGNVNVGTASASANYAGNSNYLPSSATASFTIAKAATTTVVTCAPGPFTATGSAIEPCTAVVTGPGGLSQTLAVVYSNNVAAGTATATANYAGGANYLASSDTEVFVIGEAVEAAVFLNLPYVSK